MAQMAAKFFTGYLPYTYYSEGHYNPLVSLTQSTKIPLLSEIFRRHPSAPEEIRTTLGQLAEKLQVTVAALAPLVREGYLKKRSGEEMLTSKTVIDGVPEPALVWMRSWFQPVGAKPLFGVADVADLLGCEVREVLPAAALHDVPAHRDPALGFCFSIWSTRQLLLRSVRARDHAQRFDRVALLWRILEKDPEKAAQPPKFDESLEKELARVAKLEEPTRSLRTMEIMEALRDAQVLAASLGASPASESDCGTDLS
jgi:hypothetical protein